MYAVILPKPYAHGSHAILYYPVNTRIIVLPIPQNINFMSSVIVEKSNIIYFQIL